LKTPALTAPGGCGSPYLDESPRPEMEPRLSGVLMGLRPTDGDEDILHWWRELQLAATASAGVGPFFRGAV
jgi:hypothetical protein